jgi:putative restriction endonuclease
MTSTTDDLIRNVALTAISSLVARYGQPLAWSEIAQGFAVSGQRVLFANRARGIFKPSQMRRGVLSIKTTIPRVGRGARYADIHEDEGSFIYKLQGRDPNFHDNKRLRESWEDRSPLIYFYGVSESRYEAIWPVFVTSWNPTDLSVQIDVGSILPGPESGRTSLREVERQYTTRKTKLRLHQSVFREMVLDAYQDRCAFSGLPVRRLLQAAHIVADVEPHGIAAVRNGIALSPIHHAAFDAHLLGVTPEGIIQVSDRLMEVTDGPTLEYGLKALKGSRISVPPHQAERPDRDLLAQRFSAYQQAN